MFPERQRDSRMNQQGFGGGNKCRQARRVRDREPRRPTFDTNRNETTFSQASEMFTHRGLCEVQMFNDVAYAVLAAREVLKHREPRWFRQGMKYCRERVARFCEARNIADIIVSHTAIISPYGD